MKRILCFLAVLCSFFSTQAQENISDQGIRIGAEVPDVLVNNISGLSLAGQPVRSVNLSQFRGKLLLLDFWASWCAPCRRMTPVLDSLQKEFQNDLQVLQVAYESADQLRPVELAMQKIKPYRLAGVTGDQVLNHLFPHKSLPHFVWIDQQGIVRAITEESEVTAEHIRAMVQQPRSSGLAVKRDLSIPYNRDQPLFINGNGSEGASITYHAALSGYVPGLQGGMDVFPTDSSGARRANIRNAPLAWVFLMAFSDHDRWFSGPAMRFLTKDSLLMRSRLSGSAYDQWLATGNGYCYELMVPKRLTPQFFSLMQQDVARLFPQYTVKVEPTRTRCLVLVRTSKADKLRSKGGEAAVEVGPFQATLRNVRLAHLIKRLQVQYLEGSKLPVMDGTGYTLPVDLKLDAEMSNVATLNKALAAYDLQLQEIDATVDLLVVRDNPKSLLTQP
ncbi:TlpA family protein disulfide reductase [Mucilaginibacter sp. 21P]|uniref:TlpA family protein disulfide reductase n=1 Tax=Mucilaginibacter sp. 21P TaxID=2778902 RepID=UPI001C5714E6|nr:TlpA disulfide reductase family protein [Mucilaginibacter sp. 21P]QXV63735.1 TlpA family protein disulfide reductase [Mucilaginibacter sp. 21P]